MLAVVACLLAGGARSEATGGGAGVDREAGRRIYDDGVLPSGEPLVATAPGGAPLSGAAAACARCHRPSGFGGSEGGLYVPPITAPVLAAPRRPATVSRGELMGPLYQEVHTAAARARLLALAPRPAYDATSLAAAVRDGRDPAGRTLDPAMPRYRLGDEDLARLGGYLTTLGATPAPGVEPDAIHLATVITPGADPAARDAMLAVIDAFVRHRNADVSGSLARPNHSPWHEDELAGSLRSWRVHVWELSGPPEGWTAELRERYRLRPVFALVGGLGGGPGPGGEPWQPIHGFCEAEGIPCLFPYTDLPGTVPPPRWTVYLTAGLAGEARALAVHLAEWAGGVGEGAGPLRVVQVYRDSEGGRIAARALREALATIPGVALEDRALPAAGPVEALPPAASGDPAAWVLWLGEEDLSGLDAGAVRRLATARRVYLSARLAGPAAETLAPGLGDRMRLTWPFALPGAAAPRAYRVRAWMRSRRVTLTHERLQLATHYALAVADFALDHLVDRFSREYFLEAVEHETERGLDPGLYPHLSLAPGQRVASRGCYVLRPDPDAPGGLAPDGGWIVP